MKRILLCLLVSLFLLVCGCSSNNKSEEDTTVNEHVTVTRKEVSSTTEKTTSTTKETTLTTKETTSTTKEVVTTTRKESTTVDNQSPKDDDMVKVVDYIPNIYVDLKYATTDNITGTVLYDDDEAYLRYGTVKKLQYVQNKMNELGYSLLIWDAYRPVEAQYKLWEACSDPIYMENPNEKYSNHSRGNTVDISFVKLDGSEVELPTGFDEFSLLADKDYSDVSVAAGENAAWLDKLMLEAGFKGYSGEWWHYIDLVEYDVVK